MKRPITVVISFYIAILCILAAVVVYTCGLAGTVRAKPMSFIGLASCWLLITIVCYLHEIYNHLSNKPKN